MPALLRNTRDFIKGRRLLELAGKGLRLFRREGFAGLRRIYLDLIGIGYSEWIRRYDTLTAKDRHAIRQHIDRLEWRPTISVLMPVFNPPPEFLRRAIASVKDQLYPNWALCIADDASTHPAIRLILEDAAASDPRIRVDFRSTNGHISAATNTALDMAQGEFIALLDHDDELAEHALYHVAVALNENRKLDLLYSDEDIIDAKGRRSGHYFKPDWNPDLFLAQNLISHLGVYRRTLAITAGGFREGYEGSKDWDFALRVVEHTTAQRIHHVPYILYHWRAIAGSTALSVGAKPYAVDAAQRALLDHWQRHDIAANVVPLDTGHFITQLPLPAEPPQVSLIVCTRNRLELLRQCVEGILSKTDYPNIELIIVDNGSDDAATLSYLSALHEDGQARVLRHDIPFNFSELNNFAARHAQGTLLCLLNNDVFPDSPGWLAGMVAHALRPEIGAVGAKLYYPDGRIQHAGVILNGVAAGHLHLGHPGTSAGYGNRARLPQNFSAITAACLVIRKAIWDEVSGMDGAFAVAFNDVDFCLRVQARGYRNLWLPQAELVHHESASRGTENTPEKRRRYAGETALLQQRWGSLLAHDPCWNPNLTCNGERIGPAAPPRTIPPWHQIRNSHS
jgi:glycosyltransferase involved in cell wall biosynthesis